MAIEIDFNSYDVMFATPSRLGDETCRLLKKVLEHPKGKELIDRKIKELREQGFFDDTDPK